MKSILNRSSKAFVFAVLLASTQLMVACSSAPKDNTLGAENAASGAKSADPAEKEATVSAAPTAIPSRPESSKKHEGLSQAFQSGRAEKIAEEASKVLGFDANDPVALNALALIYLKKGKPGAAKILLSRAIEKNPQAAPLFNNLGVVFVQEGNLEAAVANFKKALKFDDHLAEALGNLGSIYVGGGLHLKAVSLLEQAHDKRPSVNVSNNFAVALRMNKNYDKAHRVYEETLKKNSQNEALLLNDAIVLINHLNRPKDGLALVYKLQLLDPDKKDLLQKVNELEKKAKTGLK